MDHRIDQYLVRRVIDRLNVKYPSKYVIVDDLILNNLDLTTAKSALFEFLNSQKEPIDLEKISLDNQLFNNELVRPLILKSVAKGIKDGVVQGKLEHAGESFVPEQHFKSLQLSQVTIFEKNGIAEKRSFESVGVKNLEDFLESHTNNEKYTILSEYIVTESYIANVVSEMRKSLEVTNFVDMTSITLFGITSNSPDRHVVLQTAIGILAESLKTPLTPVYVGDIPKKLRKSTTPHYLISPTLEKEVKTRLETDLAIETARADALIVVRDNQFEELYSTSNEFIGESRLQSLPKFGEKQIYSHLLKQFSSIPTPLLRSIGTDHLTKVKEVYDIALQEEIRHSFNNKKASDLTFLWIRLTAVKDIQQKNHSFGNTLFTELKASTDKEFEYILQGKKKFKIPELESFIITELSHLLPSSTSPSAFSEPQYNTIMGNLVKLAESSSDAALIFQLAVTILHSKNLRKTTGSLGVLQISGKEASKVLKLFPTEMHATEVEDLKKAIKNGKPQVISEAVKKVQDLLKK